MSDAKEVMTGKASPLPWKVESGIIVDAVGKPVADADGETFRKDYIVRAANALPGLVEALESVLDSLGALSSRHELLGYGMKQEDVDRVYAALAAAKEGK